MLSARAQELARASTSSELEFVDLSNNTILKPDELKQTLPRPRPHIELSEPWNIAAAGDVLQTCSGSKKRGRVEWDRYWHGPLALLRLKLEAVPAEVPRSAFRVVCKHDVMSNWEFPFAGGLRRATDFGKVVQSCDLSLLL